MQRGGVPLSISEHRKRKRLLFLLIGIALILYALTLAAMFVIFRSPLFQVDHVVISGTKELSNDAVLTFLHARIPQGILGSLGGFYNLTSWPDDIKGSDLALLPKVKSLHIEKSFFLHRIEVSVTERSLYGVWCAESSEERCFWFDESGVAFERAFSTEGTFIRLVKDYSGASIGLGSIVAPDRFLPSLLSVFHSLDEGGIQAKEVRIADWDHEEVNVLTEEGPVLYFSLRFMNNSLAQAFQVFREKVNFSKLNYIDFRTEHRVFSK